MLAYLSSMFALKKKKWKKYSQNFAIKIVSIIIRKKKKKKKGKVFKRVSFRGKCACKKEALPISSDEKIKPLLF